MKRVNRFIVALVAVALVFLHVNESAFATEWPFQTIDTVDKGWSVRFNQVLDPSSVTSQNIYITDGTNIHASTPHLVDQGRTVEVMPLQPYEIGKLYRVIITPSVQSKTGKGLSESLEIPFQVIDIEAEIQAFYSITAGIFSIVTIKANPRVHRVTMNGTDMHYLGNGEYMQTLLDLKPGGTVRLIGYDGNNKRLYSGAWPLSNSGK